MSSKRENIYKGFPSDIHGHNSSGMPFISSEFGLSNKTKLLTFVGNVTNMEFLVPTSGNFFIIKGISLIGQGAQGTIKFTRGSNGDIIYPLYFSAQVRSSPSSAFNYVMNVDEKVILNTVGRGAADESFVGISYLEFNPKDYLL